jgi:tetratricopeptide (TPR) repeat protein
MTELYEVVRSVPRRPGTVWQVAVVRLPFPIRGEDGGDFHVEIALCLDLEAELVAGTEPGPEGAVAAAELVRTVVAGAVRSWGHVPETLAISDPALAAGLRETLAGTGVSVEVEPELKGLERVLALMVESFLGREDLSGGILSGEGVTVEAVAAFARAALRFHEAAPWRFLSNEDLVQVEAPEMEAGLRDLVVMGEGGMHHGLMFFPSPGHLEALEKGKTGVAIGEGVWSVSFEDPKDAVPDDLEVWEQHGLPTAGYGLIPVPARVGKGFERPDARRLAFFEGLLTALAETTEEELDSGRWEKEVETARGPLRFRLALPRLLEGGELVSEEELAEADPEDLALGLVEEAEEVARGRRRILLARRALEVWPDLAAAYEILGDLAPDPERALDFYTRGLAIAERKLGPEVFEERAGSFGDLLETEEYMSLRSLVAETLVKLDRLEEAVAHYEGLLRLDPDDGLGSRYELLDLLLELERYDEAEELLGRYPDDPEVEWPYARALVAFRREGEESPETQRRLREALRRNRYVPDYLLELRPLPDEWPLPSRPGSDAEAMLYAGRAMDLWELTGALDWLEAWVPLLREPVKVGKGRVGKKGKGKGKAKKKKRR